MQAKQTFKLPVGEWVMLHSCRLTHPKDSADLTTNMEKFLEFERRQKKGLSWQEITREVPTAVWKVRLVELVSTS